MAPILESLSHIPPNGKFGILLRHAHRLPITNWSEAFQVLITEQGKQEAYELGRELSKHGTLHLYHSPVERCAQTARAIAEGATAAGGKSEVKDAIFNIGGPYIKDMNQVMHFAKSLGKEFIRHWFDNKISSEHLLPRKQTAHLQLNSLLEQIQKAEDSIPVLVSHDWNILTVREEFLGLRHEVVGWPTFLDGVICCSDEGDHTLYYGAHSAKVTSE